MVNPDVVAYLRAQLDQFPVETLKEQLLSEGISQEDIDDSLPAALRARKAFKRRRFFGIVLMVFGGAVFLLSAANLLARFFSKPGAAGAAAYSAGSLIGHYGFIVGMPDGYVAYDRPGLADGDVERVFFCKKGTSQDNFLEERLYGGLGIVRLDAALRRGPVSFSPAEVARLVEERSKKRRETYQVKDLHVGPMAGVEFVFGAPSPRVEAYVFGGDLLYSFLGGQDDAVFRKIVMSLRDNSAEE